MLTLISFLVVIGVLIFVHELGHLIAAKSVDIAVPRFSIGFGPRIAGFRWGETEYVISLLPLGGYVRMAGMEDTAALEGGDDLQIEPSDRDFDAKPAWARAWVIVAGVLMNFIFAIFAYAAIPFFWGQDVLPSTRVEVAALSGDSAAADGLAALPAIGELTAVDGHAVQSYNDVFDRLREAGAGPTALRFADGQEVTIEIPRGIVARQTLISRIVPVAEPVIGEVQPGSAGEVAGLAEGDRVLQAAGAPVGTWTQFVDVVRANPGSALPLVVRRGGEQVTLSVTPEPTQGADAEGNPVEIGRLGVGHVEGIVHRRVGLGEALWLGWKETRFMSRTIVSLVGNLFSGKDSLRNLGGPIAIAGESGAAARLGLERVISLMAMLSVNLAVLNLLPIPVLDGGQLLFILVEAVRGRPLSLEARLRLSHVGLIMVMALMAWAITNDVLKLIGI